MKYNMPILNEKEMIHGDFVDTARISQRLKDVMYDEINHRMGRRSGTSLSYVQLESLNQICMKISRIISGDPDEEEHWDDIAGYAKLVSERHRNDRSNRPFNPPTTAVDEIDPLVERMKKELEDEMEQVDTDFTDAAVESPL